MAKLKLFIVLVKYIISLADLFIFNILSLILK